MVAYELDPVRKRFAVADAAALGLAPTSSAVCGGSGPAARARTGNRPQHAAAFADHAAPRRGPPALQPATPCEVPPLAGVAHAGRRGARAGRQVMPGVEMDEVPPQCKVGICQSRRHRKGRCALF